VFVVARDLGIDLHGPLLFLACLLAVGGTLAAAVPILLGQAAVLYTFYPPLNADVLFYLGLAVVVVASWVFAAVVLYGIYKWRRQNPGKEVPLGVWGLYNHYDMALRRPAPCLPGSFPTGAHVAGGHSGRRAGG